MAHTSRERFHQRMNVINYMFDDFLMYTLVENTGSVTYTLYISMHIQNKKVIFVK